MSGYAGSDPLEGLEQRRPEAQVAVLANEVRNQRNMLIEVKDELRYVKRALWGVVFTVLGGMLLFLASITFNVVTPHGTASAVAFIHGLLR